MVSILGLELCRQPGVTTAWYDLANSDKPAVDIASILRKVWGSAGPSAEEYPWDLTVF